jgi:hypothetical protein
VNPQHCKHCNKLFAPSPTGMGSVLCRGCAVDCDLSYPKIQKFLKEHEFVSTDQVADGAKVPAVFVLALIRDGRFGEMADVRMQATCIRCGKELQKAEVSICNPCKVLISHKMRDPVKQPTYTPPPKPASKRNDDGHKYGLGR